MSCSHIKMMGTNSNFGNLGFGCCSSVQLGVHI